MTHHASAVLLQAEGPGAGPDMSFFLMMGLWLVVAVALGLRRPRGLGGVQLRARLDAVYGEPHELVKVSPSAFPEADIEFYDRARRELEAKGYAWLADVDRTLNAGIERAFAPAAPAAPRPKAPARPRTPRAKPPAKSRPTPHKKGARPRPENKR